MMDVIGNNIANVNTVGFKSGRATFSELYAQTLRGASRPSDSVGGTNPMQVGLGMSVNTLDTMFNQGNIETTGNTFDLALVGSAFFVVNKNGTPMYTRAGNFTLDADGKLANGSGAILQGKMADSLGVIPQGTSLEDIVINKDIKSPAKATTSVSFAGNLDASALDYNQGPPVTGGHTDATVPVYDSLGNKIQLKIEYTKSGSNAWNWTATIPDGSGTATVGSGTVSFDGNGYFQGLTGSPLTITPTSGANPLTIDLDFGKVGVFSGLTQNSGTSSVTARKQDGYTAGTLLNVNVESDGTISGAFSNGKKLNLAKIMLGEFNNPAGLVRAGDNAFGVSGNSGDAAIVEAGGDTSTINAMSLEQSNVDLADEFTKMITAQRGFQASARVITTSDEFLQEVVNLKR
jgi:flagellar hook protein FlgE